MTSLPALRRWSSVTATVVVFAAVLGFVALRGPSGDGPRVNAQRGGTTR